ncbi:hypothetical protein NX059_006289 [Plenodomus lindquistii]|nr:hypothetical protein NX059_006289 [Plenodomus lindquistii]
MEAVTKAIATPYANIIAAPAQQAAAQYYNNDARGKRSEKPLFSTYDEFNRAMGHFEVANPAKTFRDDQGFSLVRHVIVEYRDVQFRPFTAERAAPYFNISAEEDDMNAHRQSAQPLITPEILTSEADAQNGVYMLSKAASIIYNGKISH